MPENDLCHGNQEEEEGAQQGDRERGGGGREKSGKDETKGGRRRGRTDFFHGLRVLFFDCCRCRRLSGSWIFLHRVSLKHDVLCEDVYGWVYE
jgi:hypothetical protein